MDKPKCRLCGDRHYGLCGDAVAVRKALAKMEPIEAVVLASDSPVVATSTRAGFDRAAYQRDYMRGYMRDWRARKKLEGKR